MKAFFQFFSTIAFALLFSFQVHAQTFKSDELAALEGTVKQFEADMSALDMQGILKIMPPKIWAFIRDRAKITDEQLFEAISKVMKETLATVKITKFTMASDAATTAQLSDGTMYVLIPTETHMRITEGETYIVKSQTLAILEDGQWYLVRINDPQQRQILGTVYPSFQGVAFPEEQSETVKD
jgi:hypothetical protein